MLSTDGEGLVNKEDVNREIADYIRMPMADSAVDSCPLVWWRNNKKFFPGLAAVARDVLCIPATSAPVERFFSTAGLTISTPWP